MRVRDFSRFSARGLRQKNTKNKMPTYPLQLTCLGVIIGTPLLASIFVILRIYTRRKLNLRLSWGKSLTLTASRAPMD